MKAWVLQANGQIEYTDFEKPEIDADEVLVEVKAAGICGSDIPRIYKGGAYFYPLIPGHEFSGQVVETNGNDTELLNKRVGIFPLIPCRECEPCQKKQYEMCRHYSYLGSRRHGAFTEYVAVPKANLIELPDNVSFEDAAMMEPMSVAAHAIRRVNPSKNDTVAICGMGTIGMFILMFLLEMGIQNIYAIGNKSFQKEMALKLGLDEDRYIDSNSDRTVAADVYFECVGKNETICRAINETIPGGKIMLVGNPYSDMSLNKATYWKILRNQLTVMGTWNSSFTGDNSDDWHYVLNKLAEGKVSPSCLISHKLSLTEFEKGLLIMRDKTEDYIKIMMSKDE
ncbi:MAG: galactitol-1-phosphate 5-dehydrogenase [Oscillospiraceae bacterium]